MVRVLVTCAGSGVGQSVLDSLNLVGGYYLVGIDSNYNVYGNHFCNEFFKVPGIYSENYLENLLELCVLKQIDLVIPGHDHELLLMSKHIQLFHNKGIEVLVSLPDIIAISRDKYEWFRFFSKRGCPIVSTYRLADFKANPDITIFPAIVKPCGGSASQGIFIVDDITQLKELEDDDIIQPYLFPLPEDENYGIIRKAVKEHRFVQMSEISIQLIFTQRSEFAGIFISKNVLKNGVPVYINPIQPEDFEYLEDIMKFVPVLLQYKVKGPVNIQGRITEKGLICFEMNMRFTGITGNRAQLGFNEVAFLVNDFLGETAYLQGYAKNKIGVRQVACTTIARECVDKSKIVFTVLGAGGNIGSYFVNELLRVYEKCQINLVCRPSSYEQYKKVFKNNRFCIFSDSDPFLQTVYNQSDVVLNFAGALANRSEVEMFEAILFQYEQVQKIVNGNVPFVLNISSQSVYNQSDDDVKKEDAVVSLDNLYSAQKYLVEKFYESSGVYSPSTKVISLRLARVISASFDSFFKQMIMSLVSGKEVVITNPLNKINLIDIRDVCRVIFFLLQWSDRSSLPPIINVGGFNMSLQEYCTNVLEYLDKSCSQYLKILPETNITVSSMIDNSLLKGLGWTPQYLLKDVIESIIKTIECVYENKS